MAERIEVRINTTGNPSAGFKRVASYADIPTGSSPQVYLVLEDETQAGAPGLYLHDGTILRPIPLAD